MTKNKSKLNPAIEGQEAGRQERIHDEKVERIRQACQQALKFTAERLLTMLDDVCQYIEDDNDLAALGALTQFADLAEDLKAAQRLFTRM